MSHDKKIFLDKIYNESCLETLKKMPDNFIDLVITSPPYNMNLRIRKGEYCSRQIVKEISTKYEGFSDNLPIEEYFEFHSNVLKELLRVSNLVFYVVQVVTGSKRAIFKLIGEFNENLKDIIIWDKKTAEPAIQQQVLNRQTELILVFEILSSTEWNVVSKKTFFIPNWYEDITKYLNIKIKAIKCYKKELRKSPHPRSLETIKALSIFRGSSSGVKNAEAFQLGRKI